MKQYIKNILFFCLVVASLNAIAGNLQPVTGILRSVPGTPVIVGDNVEIQALPQSGTQDYNVKNIVSLNFDKSVTDFLSSPTDVKVNLTVTRWDASNTLLSPSTTEDLIVTIDNRYNRKTIDKAFLKLADGYKVKVEINSITVSGSTVTSLPEYVYIESEIYITRYFNFSGTVLPTVNSIIPINTDCDTDNTDDEIQINWSTITGAEEYQLEWTYVNDYGVTTSSSVSPASLYADFKNNSTRITTTQTSYNISLAFEKGYIAVRVRAVGRDYMDPSKYIYGYWSSGANDIISMSMLGATNYYYNTIAHEKTKNWQYSSTYAEEGKKKEVISYFDGSLHNRQSVTKVNSDNNVIVGETIYDYQGRPAINVLPTPVNFPICDSGTIAPSLKYYENYNRNLAGTPYSKLNFDKDFNGNCNVSTEPMDTTLGSSQYYSGNNSYKKDNQAFVPNAEMYPFSQVEYTPDNTGRIRAQSGVGKPFQLGNNHETNYIYSQPNQIQLDRLFGSEVGDASHYKKNTVTDANGQISISYLNQEGKTIATSLAGNPPTTDSGQVYMQALASEANAAVGLTIDAFNKDLNGNSLANTVNASQNGIEFSTQISVSYNSTYHFDYSLSIDTLADPCLNAGICISCIYDLEIKVTDECGVNLTPSNTPITKKVGHLAPGGNGYTMVCTSPTGTVETDTFTVNLIPGVYTVSKILTIDEDARDYYLSQYLDSASNVNHCVKTVNDFIEDALAAIDTTACYGTCDDCIAALGSKDNFVSSGQGTDLQWEILLEQCKEPCKEMTLCEASYEMMLLDVSPGGQYAKFNEANNTASDGHSVLNTSNSMNANAGSSSNIANWKNPQMVIGGVIYKQYINDNGERVKVNVNPVSTPNGWSPEISNAGAGYLFTDAATGQKYVYPENLVHLSDFLAVWNRYFARSLVMYHPEYAYYIACLDQSKQFPGDVRSTEQFDSLLLATNSFADALTNGFIKTTYSTTVNPNNRITQWFTNGGGHAYDPFFSNPSAFDSFYGPFSTQYVATGSFSQAALVVAMQNKMANYISIPSVGNYTIVEAAAIIARCGNNFYATPTAACMDFGKDFYPNPLSDPLIAQLNDSIRDSEWAQLKNYYIAEKRKLQFSRMDFFAKHIYFTSNPNQPSPNMLGGCNACIGASSFNPYSLGFYSFPPSSTDPAWDVSQPCSFFTYSSYSNAQKRFIDPNNTGLNANNIGYQIFQQTGQCPMAFQLQNFVSSIVQSNYLNAGTDINLGSVSTFNPDLYSAVNGGVNPSTYINYKWKVISITPSVLTAQIVNPTTNASVCTFTFDITGTPIIDFTKLISVQSLSYDHTSGGQYFYKLGVGYKDAANNLHSAVIMGSSCIDIINCSFPPECQPNTFASDVMNLINVMGVSGLAYNTNYNMSANAYVAPAITSVIKNTLGASTNDMIWNFVAPDKVELYYNGTPSNKLLITILSFNPASATSSTISYSNIRSNYNNLFKMDAMDASGVKIADVDGKVEKIIGGVTSGISMGECGLPDDPNCSLTEHKVREDLELLINEFVGVTPFTGNINLYTQASLTTLLQSYLPDSIAATTSTYLYSSSYDTLRFDTQAFCKFELYHNTTHPGAQLVNFNQLVGIRNLTGIAPYDAQQNYHRFYFIGKYNVSGLMVEDTVFGESCFPLKNCTSCDPVYDSVVNGGLTLQELDSLNVGAGKASFDKNVIQYEAYTTAIDSLNLRNGWTTNNPSYVPAIEYLSFAQKDYQYAYKYIDYVNNYDTLVDSAQYLAIDKFVSDYGNFTNCTKEYDRYARAINKYNTRAIAFGTNLLSPITDSSFYVNKLCDVVASYIKYLSAYPTIDSLSPVTAYQYFHITNVPPADSCSILYKHYVTVYKQFQQNSAAQYACKVAQILHPLYGFNVIEKSNLCCSNQGLALFNNYINGLANATNSCPPLLQSLDSCSTVIQQEDINPQFCQRNYIFFINKINQYNTSAYAIANSHSLDPNIYPTYKLFQKAGYCDCIIDYINYLNSYVIAAGSSSLPLPVDIDHYSGCTHTVYPPSPADECKIKYAEYLSTIDLWNGFVSNNDSLNYPGIKIIFTYQEFVSLYCNCADKFIADLTAIINGNRPTSNEVEEIVYLPNACIIPDCPRVTPDTAFTFPPVPYSQNPCVAQMIEGAIQNALNDYNNYVDSVTTDFVNRYNAHCLKAVENLLYTYTDKEYHFTLYYYDQAGNLVKTIPPEGIEKLNITSPTSPDEIRIKQDRLLNTQTVYTSHRMATTYEYNSLNQLVRQDMPDHDKMDVCENILPNGLDADLTIVGVQMINSNKGFLTGYLTRTIAGSSINRGYVYTTNDGGLNWSRIKGLAAGDIQKVQMVTSTVGYAVSNYGLVFKTLDGGYSWDALTTLYNASPKYFDQLNDLYFISATTGIVGGVKGTGANGGVYKTTDGGLTYTAANGFTTGDFITGLTYDGTNYFASATNSGIGKVYRSADGITWVSQNAFVANSLKHIQYLGSNNKAIAVGYDGTLLKSNTGNTNWTLVATNKPYAFSDVYFKSENYGVALIDSIPGKARVYKTLDGGNTWTVMSAPGKYYTSFQKYDSIKVIAAGEAGLLSKIVMTSAPFSIINLNTAVASLTDNFNYVDAVIPNTGKLVTLAVSTSSTVRFTYDAQASIVNWESFNTGVSGGFKKSLISVSNGASPIVSGILLGNDGIVYKFYRPYLATPVYTAITTSATFINDITSNNSNNTFNFYAFDNIGNVVYNLVYSGSAVSSTLMTSPGITGTINSINMNNGGGRIVLAGNDGKLVYGSGITIGSAAVTWQDVSVNVLPLPLNDITAAAANSLNAVGNDGTQWNTTNGGTTWTLTSNGVSDQLNAVKLNSTASGIIGANGGRVYAVNSALTPNPAIGLIATTSVDNITDVAIASTGTNAFASTAGGRAIFINNYTGTSSVTALASNVNGALNGLAYLPGGGLAVAVGNKAGVILYGGASGIIINDVFTHALKSAHFYDANNGYVVDSGYVLRHTINGGATWSVVLPKTNTPSIAKVYSVGANKAIVIGKNVYAGVITGNGIPVNAIVAVANTALDFKDINFNAAGKGIIVGNQGEAYTINASGSSYAVADIIPTHADTSFTFQAVHVFGNGNFIAVGNKGNIYYYNGAAFIKQTNYPGGPSNAVKFYDVYFHDDRVGYVVGASGKAIKCTLSENIELPGSQGMITDGITWADFCPLAVYGSHTPSNVDFSSIAFSTRTSGFIAGRNNMVNNHLHALVLSDESMLYSTRFWYDKLGRMVVSQNTRQYPIKYSYTLYDELGRITEVGEKYENASVTKQPTIFGTSINGLFNTKAIDDSKLLAWISDGTGARKEVTKTYYDAIAVAGLPIVQDNLRKRVSTVTYEDVFDGNNQTYQHATHYTYDIHGNVNTLLQDNKKMYDDALAASSAIVTERFKQIDYEYDLISGKVNKVSYQPTKTDQFYHKYTYDADNRITKVETSNNDIVWDIDAKYFYYAHGPLARVEYGNDKVQGLDYAYTLQGWIKGINSTSLEAARDMGKDGWDDVNNSNKYVAKDAMSYSLNYFQGDYKAIDYMQWNDVLKRFEATTVNSQLQNARYDLFNGNISSMVTTLAKIDTIVPSGLANAPIVKPLGNAYKYDQLNRLMSSVAYDNINLGNNAWDASGQTVANMYANSFTYDANGNILTQNRRDSAGVEFDAMIYKYQYLNNNPAKLTRNRLYHVNDNTSYTSVKSDDIDDQAGFNSNPLSINVNNNYNYDAIGNLTKDSTEQISNIEWTVYGKIKKITRSTGSTKDNLAFDYDASGNRIAKHVYDSSNQWKKSTYYIRDAQGNVMSTYEHTVDNVAQTVSFKLQEQHLYGSSRIGMNLPDYEMVAAVVNADGTPMAHVLGKKQYEMSNHLGNVLTVVSDRKIPVDANSDLAIDHYLADVLSTSDYYPFGSVMKERGFSAATGYRYGFNGHEKDDEIKGDGNSYTTEFRQYDPRLGKWMSMDANRKAAESPYAAFANNPICFGDPNGKDTLRMHLSQVKSPAGTVMIFVVDFELIKNGVSTMVEAPMNLSGTSSIYFMIPKANFVGRNKMPNPFYSIRFQRMASHGDLSKEWNENTILMRPPGGGDDRGQFAHPGNSDEASAGCFIPTSFPSAETIKKIPARPEDGIGSYFQVLTEASGDDKISKDMLNQIRQLFITSQANNSVGTFDFQATMRPPPMQSIPTIQYKSIPTGDGSTGSNGGTGGTGGTDNSGGSDDGGSSGSSGGGSRPSFDCFIVGTLITMSDGTLKPIEKIVVGDKILSMNAETMKIEADEVLKMVSPIHDDIVTLKFSDGTINGNTFDHPYYVKGKGLCSYKPEQTKLKYGIEVKQLTIGDTCYKYLSNNLNLIELMYATEIKGDVQTYNVSALKNNNSYFANGVLVNNEKESSVFKYTDSTLFKRYQNFSIPLLDLFRDKNTVDLKSEFIFRDKKNGLDILDGYWFYSRIEKQNDTTFNFYLNTHFPIKNIDSLEQPVTLKYVFKLNASSYTIELDSNFQALPKMNSKEISAVIQKYKKYKSMVNSGQGSKIQKDFYLLDYELTRAALSGSKECATLFNSMEKDYKNYLDPTAMETHKNTLGRILSDYGLVKAPHSTRKFPVHFKRTYDYVTK